MSNWQKICDEQRSRLEKTEVLADKLESLCGKMQSHIGGKIIDGLRIERERLERQLNRLRAKRFEVAVIGLEKSGKSALLNAWLGREILPSEDRRCTYTTTEIVSVPTRQDQSLLIKYYNREEFEQLLQSKKFALTLLNERSREYSDLKNDIEKTEQGKEIIYQLIRESQHIQPKSFIDIEEIRKELYEAVAGQPHSQADSGKVIMDRSRPRAIKHIQLATTHLVGESGIVFHDVPGFNSPVSKHREEAEQRMRDCDAIIFAKKMDNFNLDVSETNMLAIADADHIPLEQKIFVVLTRVDSALNREQYDEWLHNHRHEWEKVPINRIVPVCPIAYLARAGDAARDMIRLGNIAAEKLQDFGIDDGIAALKQAVNEYIDQERSGVLKKRCNAIVSEYQKQAGIILEALLPYRQSLDDITSEEDLYGESFNQWWGREWACIKQDFLTWYQDVIMLCQGADGRAGEHEKLAELRSAYNEEVEKLFQQLITAQRGTMERIYRANEGDKAPTKGHFAIRDQLYREVQHELRQKLPKRLTVALDAISQTIVSKAQDLLFGVTGVSEKLLGDQRNWEKQLHYGFETLFLRFGREAVDIFIQYPLDERGRLLEEKAAEICTLEAFYSGEDTKSHLTDYIRTGLWVIRTVSDLGLAPRIVSTGIKMAEKFETKHRRIEDLLEKSKTTADQVSTNSIDFTEKPAEAENFDAVVAEIKVDLEALEDYLKRSVFYAAGFIAYSRQELERLKERFVRMEDPERQWDYLVGRAAKREDPNIPFKMTERLQDFRFRRELAQDIREIQTVLLDLA